MDKFAKIAEQAGSAELRVLAAEHAILDEIGVSSTIAEAVIAAEAELGLGSSR